MLLDAARRLHPLPLVAAVTLCAFVALAGCGAQDTTETSAAETARANAEAEAEAPSTTTTAPVQDVEITAESFVNLQDMTPVRGFFVDNLLGDLEATVAVAESPDGGVYPVGSVVQLVPGEAMVKRAPGFDVYANDWEFFELDVSEEGTEIRVRGGAEVVNRFGGSCSDCHALAEPQWDFICEQDHGCEPLPFERAFFEALQDGDPRPRLA